MRAVSNQLIMNFPKAVTGLLEVCINDRSLHIPGGIRIDEWMVPLNEIFKSICFGRHSLDIGCMASQAVWDGFQ